MIGGTTATSSHFLMHREPFEIGRNRPAHPVPIRSGNQTILVVITVCTAGRRAVLADPKMHSVLLDAWQRADRWLVGRYVIMPDHVHLFAAPATAVPESLPKWLAYWKSLSARAVKSLGITTLWQRDFWDTQLRSSDSYAEKWDYFRMNAVRAGLVGNAEDWPYQGEMHFLNWHDR